MSPGACPVPLVIGVGNELRGDDGAGLLVARAVRTLQRAGRVRVRVAEQTGELLGLLDLWWGAGLVVLVDCVRSGAAPGTVHDLDPDAPLPRGAAASSHGLQLTHTLQLARRLRRLPRRLVLVGIEGRCFDRGTPVTPPVRAAAARVSRRIERLLPRRGS